LEGGGIVRVSRQCACVLTNNQHRIPLTDDAFLAYERHNRGATNISKINYVF
jgi:hypothetical protein